MTSTTRRAEAKERNRRRARDFSSSSRSAPTGRCPCHSIRNHNTLRWRQTVEMRLEVMGMRTFVRWIAVHQGGRFPFQTVCTEIDRRMCGRTAFGGVASGLFDGSTMTLSRIGQNMQQKFHQFRNDLLLFGVFLSEETDLAPQRLILVLQMK